MAEFNQGGVSTPNTSFTKVTTKAKPESAVGAALSAVVQGVSTFGPQVAADAGARAARDQFGSNLSESDIQESVAKTQRELDLQLSLGREQNGGRNTTEQIKVIKDELLTRGRKTTRELDALHKAGVLSLTEVRARSKIEFASALNEGANYMFRKDFEDVYFRSTGGSRGTAVSALFAPTAEEKQATANADAERKAIAKVEAQVASNVQITGRSESVVRKEMAFNAQLAQRKTEIEARKLSQEIGSDVYAEELDIDQASSSQAAELQLSSLKVNGVVEDEALIQFNSSLEKQGQRMRADLSKQKGLSRSARDALGEDIDDWVKGNILRASASSKNAKDKRALETLNTSVEFYGVAAGPMLAALDAINPDLAAAVALLPRDTAMKRIRLNLGEEGYNNFLRNVENIKSTTSFYGDQSKPIKEPGAIALANGTDPGKLDAEESFSAEVVPSKWVDQVNAAPGGSIDSTTWPNWLIGANNDVEETQVAVKGIYDIFRGNIQHALSARQLASGVTVSVERGPRNRSKISVDIPNQLIGNGDPNEYKEGITQLYKAFRSHVWIWRDDFTRPEDALNAYLDGSFDIVPSKKREGGDGQASTTDRRGRSLGRRDTPSKKEVKPLEEKLTEEAAADKAALIDKKAEKTDLLLQLAQGQDNMTRDEKLDITFRIKEIEEEEKQIRGDIND